MDPGSEPVIIAAAREALVSVDISDAVAGVESIVWATGDGYLYSGKPFIRHTYLTAGAWNGSVTVTDRAGNRTVRPFTVTIAAPPPVNPAPTPPTVKPAPALPDTTAPALPDTTAPALWVRASSRQRVRAHQAVSVTVSCSERCAVAAGGKLVIAGRRYALRAAPTWTLETDARASFRLALSSGSRAALARALSRGQRATATVSVAGVDAAGNRSARTVRIRAL